MKTFAIVSCSSVVLNTPGQQMRVVGELTHCPTFHKQIQWVQKANALPLWLAGLNNDIGEQPDVYRKQEQR
ncbi:hypothetical protein BDV36DRAFT_278429 [Aspergillus pseudocaelatus]|uniref:Uncharacterized protein n=1 Tax=Aspergillus pseudocaelatus TaxID=1825620 RepID=A0ABQ6VZD1_9EURO|nr:hypothetical protein BDV36DRAFT_278429 [Aspergillus pseudocaelatus]